MWKKRKKHGRRGKRESKSYQKRERNRGKFEIKGKNVKKIEEMVEIVRGNKENVRRRG